MKNKTIRWGIMGLGKIARKFAQDLLISNGELAAVASRDIDKAQTFASEYNAKRYYGDYPSLVHDNAIDVIYIATPHTFHYENTMLCLENGKSVLCEKPFAINSREVQKMIATAKSNNLFLMEAIWTRFIPGIEKVLEILNSGSIGEIKNLEANFGFIGDTSPEGRLYNRSLGGGALLDIGIYPVYLSLLLLGLPESIKAKGVLKDNVDLSCEIQLTYSNNVKSHLECTFLDNTSTEAIIYGEKGKLIIHRRFHHPTKIEVLSENGQNIFEIPYRGNGYYHEIEEVNNLLLHGVSESAKLSWNNSLDLVNTLDQIRSQLGVSYPNDENF